jgi:hypothetical protein
VARVVRVGDLAAARILDGLARHEAMGIGVWECERQPDPAPRWVGRAVLGNIAHPNVGEVVLNGIESDFAAPLQAKMLDGLPERLRQAIL